MPQSNNIKAVLLRVHGVSMWSGSFRQHAERMTQESVATYAIDVPGFGPAANENGQWNKADPKKAVFAFRQVIKDLHARHPSSPIFVLGESMGASFVIRLGALYPEEIDGIICSALAWHICGKRRLLLDAAVKVLFLRKHPFEHAVSVIINQATDDKKLQVHWKESPEYRFQFSTGEVLRGLSFLRKTSSYARRIKHVPVLMSQGLNDRLVQSNGQASNAMNTLSGSP